MCIRDSVKIDRESALKQNATKKRALKKSGDIFLARILFSEREYQRVNYYEKLDNQSIQCFAATATILARMTQLKFRLESESVT